MPVWHERTRDLVASGDLVLLGVTQEQHADRCRLFAQWKGFEFPILHDPFNQLGTRVVPVITLIDENGNVQSTRPQPASLADSLQSPPTEPVAPIVERVTIDRLAEAARGGDADVLAAWADALVLWGGADRLTSAIEAYRAAQPTAERHFRLGVAHRLRYDSEFREPADFADAVAAWSAALESDPGHYIFRRRLQQYGPRLDKPYPFYDWVVQAQRELTESGERPVELVAEPRGAEIAAPSRDLIVQAAGEAPDPTGAITRDESLVAQQVVIIPQRVAPGEVARVHLTLRPAAQTFWNNEVEPLVVWWDVPDGWQVDQPRLTSPLPTAAESQEERHLEFEVRVGPGERALTGYALYYVCEDENGQCLYRRKDLRIEFGE